MKVKILEAKKVVTKIEVEDAYLIDQGKLAKELALRLGRSKPYTRARVNHLLVHGLVKSEKIIQALEDIPMDSVKFERTKRKRRSPSHC